MVLSRDDIIALTQTPAKVEKVTVPGAGEFCLKVMTGTELGSFREATLVIVDGKPRPDFRRLAPALLVRTLCDEGGQRLFTDADTALLGKMSGPIMEQLAEAAQTLNALDADAVEQAEKNLPLIANSSSGTDSPPTSGAP